MPYPTFSTLRRTAAALAGAVALLGLCFAAGMRPARAQGSGAEVMVRVDQEQGRFFPERFTNLCTESVYGETMSLLSEPAFAWVRASNALSYVRCYNWLGDGIPQSHPEWFSGCRVARTGPNGAPVYQWEGLERVLDVLVASDVKPWIVCGIPDALVEGPVRRNESGAAVNRPKDYARYRDMLSQMITRLEKTYGPEEVRTWYFEVLAQADHEGSWEMGRPAPFEGEIPADRVEPFNRLYDHFVAGITSVDPQLKVGGPGLAGDPSFLKHFLEHCARGKNTATGGKGTRIDFVSWSRYGSVEDTVRWNAELRKLVETGFPELKNLQFVLAENGPDAVEASRSNTAAEAARLAALVDANARAEKGVDLIFRTGELANEYFEGFRPLITRLGQNTVPTPAFRFYQFLARMGSERLKTEPSGGVGALAASQVGAGKSDRAAAQVLVYRYAPGAQSGEAVPVKVRFTGLPKKLLRLPVRTYRIDPQHNAPYEAWDAAGKLKPAPQSVTEKLVGKSALDAELDDPNLAVTGGEATVEVSLAPNSVALVTIGAEPSYGVKLGKRAERLRKAEQDYAKAADSLSMRDGVGAVTQLRQLAKDYVDTFWREVALYSLWSLYRTELRSPVEARALRQELLALPIDDQTRLKLLLEERVDIVRRNDTAGAARIAKEIEAIDARLSAQRKWDVRRLMIR